MKISLGKRREKQRSKEERCTGEHNDGRFWKTELVDEKIFHALSIVDASLELVPGEPVRDAYDDGLLSAVGVGRGAGRRVVVGGWWRMRLVGSRGLRRDGAWVGDESDCVADGAADGSGARWQLQRDAAVGTVDQHVAVHDYTANTERLVS